MKDLYYSEDLTKDDGPLIGLENKDVGLTRMTFTFWIPVYSFCQNSFAINYSSVSHPICSTFIKEPSACSSHPVCLASSF